MLLFYFILFSFPVCLQLGGLMSERLKHPKKWLVRLCLWLLSTCIGSLILCGRYCFSSKFPYMHSFTQLPQNKREAVLVSWSLSYFYHLRMLYKAMKLLIFLVFFTQVWFFFFFCCFFLFLFFLSYLDCLIRNLTSFYFFFSFQIYVFLCLICVRSNFQS